MVLQHTLSRTAVSDSDCARHYPRRRLPVILSAAVLPSRDHILRSGREEITLYHPTG